MIKRKNPILWGIIFTFLMLLFYAGIMLSLMGTREAWLGFLDIWYFIIGIAIGFGIQMGLWRAVKNISLKQNARLAGVSAVISGTAMVVCCAHHFVEFFIIIGLSGTALFLSNYQKSLLGLGISINALGIAYMLFIFYKHSTSQKQKTICH